LHGAIDCYANAYRLHGEAAQRFGKEERAVRALTKALPELLDNICALARTEKGYRKDYLGWTFVITCDDREQPVAFRFAINGEPTRIKAGYYVQSIARFEVDFRGEWLEVQQSSVNPDFFQLTGSSSGVAIGSGFISWREGYFTNHSSNAIRGVKPSRALVHESESGRVLFTEDGLYAPSWEVLTEALGNVSFAGPLDVARVQRMSEAD
jgi:hypothetical protein